MKITKLGHACLLVEMPAPVNRTVLFDPGAWSDVNVDSLEYLDDIIVTHEHGDHMDMNLIKQLVQKFPDVRIVAADGASRLLNEAGLTTLQDTPEGITIFDSPHESVEPLFPRPDNIGVHYLDTLTHPGDCISFNETKTILALPVAAPWGSTVRAVNHAIKLHPQYVIPIHDWHWSDEAKSMMYDRMSQVFADVGINFCKVENGRAIVLDV